MSGSKFSLKKRLSVITFSLITAVFFAMCFAVSSFNANADLSDNAYKYTLTFQDDFNSGLNDGWAKVTGGKSYTYTQNGATKKGWNFQDAKYIGFKDTVAIDYGKLLYGTASSTNYIFEVKVRVDTDQTVGEFLESCGDSIESSELTMNHNLPFFVYDTAPDTNYHTFRGRSVCFSNYAIGFWEAGGTGNSGWAGNVRIKNLLGEDFTWNDWHTIRVEATTDACTIWLDGVQAVKTLQSGFTRVTDAKGYCGMVGACSASSLPLYYDDFKFYSLNANYDATVKVTEKVNSLNASDFRDKDKILYQSSTVDTALVNTTDNKLIYNDDCAFGTDKRLLKDNFTDFETVMALDIENQKKAKGVVEGEVLSTVDVRTSVATTFMFNGEDTDGSETNISFKGYMLSYYAVYSQTSKTAITNNITLALYKDNTNSTNKIATLGILSGTTSCVLKIKVANGKFEMTVYKTAQDYTSGTYATLTNTASAVTVTNGVYSLNLPDYDTSKGGTYTEGQLGFWCNSGGTSTKYNFQAEILSFTGNKTVGETPLYKTQTASDGTLTVTAGENGKATIDGVETSSKVITANSNATVKFIPNDGFVVDNVKINGYNKGAITEYTFYNMDSDNLVEVTFSDKKNIDIYILAGQSNAAGFTPIKGVYNGYPWGGTPNAEKIDEYEKGYQEVMYYGVTQTADVESANGKWTTVSIGQGGSALRMGPELGFGEVMSEFYGGEKGKSAVIKYAVGSTTFSYASSSATVKNFGNWMCPTTIARHKEIGTTLPEKSGLLYNNLLATVTNAINELVAQGYTPVFKGAFWMQGCGDSTIKELAEQYGEHLGEMITDLRADLEEIASNINCEQDLSKMPFVIGKINPNLEASEYEYIVRGKMQQLTSTMEGVRVVETYDMILPDPNDNNDRWHFSSKDCLTLGQRFGDIMAQEVGLKDEVTYTVTFKKGEETLSTQTVKKWLSATDYTPSVAGFSFGGWYLDGETQEFNFSETAIDSDITLYGKFTALPCTVSVGEVVNGTVTVTPSENLVYGDQVTITATPNEGYKLESILVNGSVIEGNTFTITQDIVVTATFIKLFTVSVGEVANGTVTVTPSENLVVGDQITITATPNEGYRLVCILVDGQVISSNTFTVTKDCVVTANFEVIPTETEKSGCGSTISVTSLSLFAVIGLAFIGLKKKTN